VLNTENFKRLAFVVGLALVLFGVDSANAADPDDSGSFLASLKNVANPSTVPANGDQNPYGVAFVSHGGGLLKAGSILVSNFNNSMNLQGTGTTIVQIDKHDNQSLFFRGKRGLGLTTALGVLPQDLVVVGNLPATDDMSGTVVMQGSLLIVSPKGVLIDTLTSSTLLDGPWDLTVQANGNSALVFVSNVLSGTVTRLNIKVKRGTPTVTSMTQIASGYLHRTDPAALVIGPTGLVFDSSKDLLYVASTGDNEIFSIANASTATDNGMGTLVYSDPAHLHGPLALAMAPNGDLLTSNGDAVNPDPRHNSEIVEFTPSGSFVDELQVDSALGAAFGIAVSNGELAAVDDNANTLGMFVDSDADTGMGGMGMMGM